jgi:hypothetical protein
MQTMWLSAQHALSELALRVMHLDAGPQGDPGGRRAAGRDEGEGRRDGDVRALLDGADGVHI